MIIKNRQSLGKKEIVHSLKAKIGTSSTNIQKITDDMIDILTNILIDQKKINIKNFGSFNIVYKNERVGRNPKTKEEFTITSRNAVKFKPSKEFKQIVSDI